MTGDFGGFGAVLQLGLGIGLIAVWNARQRIRADEDLAVPKTVADQQISQRQTFKQLQSLLVNYPTARKSAQAQPDMLAKNITPLFTPLENLLAGWGYEAIGQPWAVVEFDPLLHQPDTEDIGAGETVYVRFIGYRCGEEIIVPAKISRTLPPQS